MAKLLYEEAGGERKVRAIIDAFVDRMVDDLMIGFFFRNVPRRRLKELEFQHAAAALGAPVTYRGRPIADVHRPHNILGGQFARRKQILREVLDAAGVPASVRDAWLAHQEALRQEVTGSPHDGCDGAGAAR